jgi:hypothetical protein
MSLSTFNFYFLIKLRQFCRQQTVKRRHAFFRQRLPSSSHGFLTALTQPCLVGNFVELHDASDLTRREHSLHARSRIWAGHFWNGFPAPLLRHLRAPQTVAVDVLKRRSRLFFPTFRCNGRVDVQRRLRRTSSLRTTAG